MFDATWSETSLISLVAEGYLYGIYSGVFAMYIQYQAEKKDVSKTKNILFCSLCVLYILSALTVALDVATLLLTGNLLNLELTGSPTKPLLIRLVYLYRTSNAVAGICDFISQAILIHRCRVVWGGNTRIIVIPSILALAYLATWLSATDDSIGQGQVLSIHWGKLPASLVSLFLSLVVNSIVTSLIVLMIIKVYREVNPTSKPDAGETWGASSGCCKYRSIIFVIIESGMALFAIQLIRVCTTVIIPNSTTFYVVIGINQMITGITPTVMLVLISVKLSYHDEKSLEESVSSLCCVPHDRGPILDSEIGSVHTTGQESIHVIQHMDAINIEGVQNVY